MTGKVRDNARRAAVLGGTFYRPNVRIMLAEAQSRSPAAARAWTGTGHDSEKGAMACFRRLASERGAKIL